MREAIAEIVTIRALLEKGAPDRVDLDINEVIQEVAVLVHNEATRSSVSVRLEP